MSSNVSRTFSAESAVSSTEESSESDDTGDGKKAGLVAPNFLPTGFLLRVTFSEVMTFFISSSSSSGSGEEPSFLGWSVRVNRITLPRHPRLSHSTDNYHKDLGAGMSPGRGLRRGRDVLDTPRRAGLPRTAKRGET